MAKSFIALLSCVVAGSWAGVAEAQQQAATASTSDAGQIEEILVTAQRRSESSQNVPITINAISADALKRAALVDVTDLKEIVPGLNVEYSNGSLNSQLRGVGSTVVSPGFENPVAVYVDGVYYASQEASIVGFSDIERVEVLKGPQGTLFGRNATGGLIQIITKDPSQQFGGAANISYGNYQTARGDAYLTGPITDSLAASLAVQGTHMNEGWGTNLYSGQQVDRDQKDISVRSKLLYATDGTRAIFAADYNDTRNSMNSQVLLPGSFAGPAGPFSYRGWDTNVNDEPYIHHHSGGLSLTVEQDLGFANLKNITAYRYSNQDIYFDFDLTPAPISTITFTEKQKEFSQELQLLSKNSGPLTWVTGVYYFWSPNVANPYEVFLAGPASPLPFPIGLHDEDKNTTRSYAGYGQGTLALPADTKVTLGARYTHEVKVREGTLNTLANGPGVLPAAPGVFVPVSAGTPLGPPDSFPEDALKYNKITFRASLDHNFAPDVLGYLSFNRGFKSGGFNPVLYPQTLTGIGTYTFTPEQLDASELGLKSQFFDRTVQVNAAFFFYDYTNLQIPTIGEGALLVVNGAKAHIYGIDTDVEWRASTALRFTGGVEWVHDRYVSFPLAPTGSASGNVPLTLQPATGNTLPFVSQLSIDAGGDYTQPLPGGTLAATVNSSYASSFAAASDNVVHQPAYVFLNASLRWAFTGDRYTVTAYGRNLLNRRVLGALQEFNPGTQDVSWDAPRTYGLTFGAKF